VGLEKNFRPQKLKILAYGKTPKNKEVEVPPHATFEVMYNPESVVIEFRNRWQKPQGIGTHGVDLSFAANEPERIRFKLIFGGTDVDNAFTKENWGTTIVPGAMSIINSSDGEVVIRKVEEFLKITTQRISDSHDPCFLVLQWGTVFTRLADTQELPKIASKSLEKDLIAGMMKSSAKKLISYPCRLESVDLAYTQFDRQGNPLRAELDTVFMEDGKNELGGGLQSPDVTHARTVKAGDSLPLMADDIYQDSSWYMKIAETNQLDSVRNIRAGESIVFPPIAG